MKKIARALLLCIAILFPLPAQAHSEDDRCYTIYKAEMEVAARAMQSGNLGGRKDGLKLLNDAKTYFLNCLVFWQEE